MDVLSENDNDNKDALELTCENQRLSISYEHQILDRYFWKQDAVFNVKIDNIRVVQNLETNYQVFTKKRVLRMYAQLREKDWGQVGALILRPMMYIMETKVLNGENLKKKVVFYKEGATKQFDATFLQYANAPYGEVISTSKTN